MDELKPCPFCGGKAEINSYSDDLSGRNIWVMCTKCENILDYDALRARKFFSEKEAVTAWNTRAERTCVWSQLGSDADYGRWHTSCREMFEWQPDGHPRYCPNCGARVVTE